MFSFFEVFHLQNVILLLFSMKHFYLLMVKITSDFSIIGDIVDIEYFSTTFEDDKVI